MFMEPNFQVETAHDQDAYNNMVTAHYMLHEKNSIKSLYALAVVLALCVWWIAAGGNYTSIRALGSGITTLAIVLLLVPYVDRFAARQVCHRLLDRVVKAAKKNKFYGIPTRYRFYDDKLDASDSAGSVETPYSQVTDLVETELYFLVFLKSGQCVLAPKTDFTVGEAADFKDFLTRACGRDMRFFEMPKRNGR